tara:strand:- start:1392 stop:2006 length:615 start_codon:yes stop_codon:yes gene_type:complete
MKSLLIDFDGIIFNNKRITERIKHRSIQYISSRKHISYPEAKIMNKLGYTKLGHTSRIISDNHVHDYNVFVFDDNMFRYIYDEINEKDIRLIQQIIDVKNKRNMELVLCTNAPYNYCKHVVTCTGSSMDHLFHPSIAFTSDNGICKPLQQYYENIEKTCEPNDDSYYHFIDDSIINITPCLQRNKWNACVISKESELFEYLNNF